MIVTSTSSRRTWEYGGELTQVYEFSQGSINEGTDEVLLEPFKLILDKLIILDVTRVSLDPSRLLFTPPDWFKQVNVKVYAYTGNVINVLEDTVRNIDTTLTQGTGGISQALEEKLDSLDAVVRELIVTVENLECAVGDSQGLADISIKLDEILACHRQQGCKPPLTPEEKEKGYFIIS